MEKGSETHEKLQFFCSLAMFTCEMENGRIWVYERDFKWVGNEHKKDDANCQRYLFVCLSWWRKLRRDFTHTHVKELNS